MKPITKLAPNEVFVFGSNLAGRHGKGAALTARKLFGAVTGIPKGHEGKSYAIPTKGGRLEVLPRAEIAEYVKDFLHYAMCNPELRFLVTPIGCGLAGYKPEDIAHMFRLSPSNVILPDEFKAVLNY